MVLRQWISAIGAVCLIGLGPAASGAGGEMAGKSVPYTWRNVVIRGGGFVTGIIVHPGARGLMYARTDVGGAYRWDDSGKRWVPITDWIGAADANLTGIESLAVDPEDTNRVYLAAGTYDQRQAAMLSSDDQGRTFRRTDVPFSMGGNEAGRFNGERLAVDPHLGSILLFGSRHDGLWRSSDRGATWNKVESFPAPASDRLPAAGGGAEDRPRFGGFQQAVGIVCVVFDPSTGLRGQPTPGVYAGVSTTGTNLFHSADAGGTWQAVAGQPLGLRPNHVVLAPDGWLYLSYGREPGPNSMTDGAIWKFNPATGAWANITPVKPSTSGQPFGYGAVAVDARHPSTIVATTFCHWQPNDQIYRSTNGGTTWTELWLDNTVWDHAGAPYTKSRKPHWMGDVEINPFNPDQVLFTTGYGIWSSLNATRATADRPARWVFLDDGLEETVPLALLSPPSGAHLLSGLGDIDGFRHDDLEKSPDETFAGPHFGNTESLAMAGNDPQVIARTGTSRERGQVRAAYSLDGGRSWDSFGSEPPGSGGAGSITIAADGKTIVWTPRRSDPYYTTDKGSHWLACQGLASGINVVADPVNPSKFYACDARSGDLFVSTNGAAMFAPFGAAVPRGERSPRLTGGFGGGEMASLSVAPGREGDLWLGFRREGLYHSVNGGLSWVALKDVQQAVSVGFGKPAPGKSQPALYLAGRVNQLEALFRSDDGGDSWVRINDDLHQFGAISQVTGDPRIFGRVYFATGGRGVVYGDPATGSDAGAGKE